MWLPLAEYSMKHKVSISTLRRKIKAEEIKYRLDDGKYFLLDEAEDAANGPRPSLNREPKAVIPEQSIVEASSQKPAESVITAANRLLADLKKAYTQVLQDKELQIVALKEEIADLKTLVKILESEDERLRSGAKKNDPSSGVISAFSLDSSYDIS
jgi:hypothetical protein